MSFFDSLSDGIEAAVGYFDDKAEDLTDEIKNAFVPGSGNVPDGVGIIPDHIDGEWTNEDAGYKSVVVEPLRRVRPQTLYKRNNNPGIVECVAFAVRNKLRAKAVGSGHSYSDIAWTPDLFFETDDLNQIASERQPLAHQLAKDMLNPGRLPLHIGDATWDGPYDPSKPLPVGLVEIEAGIKLKDLNVQLWNQNMAMLNLGGYTGQAFIGASSTSTHGTGITLGPFSTLIASMVIVCTGRITAASGVVIDAEEKDGVFVYRIEGEGDLALTNPQKFHSEDGCGLVQNDGIFKANTVAMGCMGIVYSAVIRVTRRYWLKKESKIVCWADAKKLLKPNEQHPQKLPKLLTNHRHASLLLCPAQGRTKCDDKNPVEFKCAVEITNVAEEPKETKVCTGATVAKAVGKFPRVSLRKKDVAKSEGLKKKIEDDAALAGIVALSEAMNDAPKIIPPTVNLATTVASADAHGRSYEVLVTALPGPAGFASEVSFSIEDGNGTYDPTHFINAADEILRVNKRSFDIGEQGQTSPMGLRFVAADTNSLIGMMAGRMTGTIEFDMATRTFAGRSIMYRNESLSYKHGGRPHWGLNFSFFGSAQLNNEKRPLYPEDKLKEWRVVFEMMNPHGTFDNSFTERMGFSQPHYEAGPEESAARAE